jgi:hypothetical protein
VESRQWFAARIGLKCGNLGLRTETTAKISVAKRKQSWKKASLPRNIYGAGGGHFIGVIDGVGDGCGSCAGVGGISIGVLVLATLGWVAIGNVCGV